MTIANGCTNCQAERHLVLQGFIEQIQILENSHKEQEGVFKAHLYDIITDNSISDEEKASLKTLWINELEELEERHVKIRRSVFIGLYSFWELSLMDIINTYCSTQINFHNESLYKSKIHGTGDYIKMIYGNSIPQSVKLIDNNIREFRNYLVHGSLTERREQLIKELQNSHLELCIKSVCRNYFFSSYNGLKYTLEVISNELDKAENKSREIKNNKI